MPSPSKNPKNCLTVVATMKEVAPKGGKWWRLKYRVGGKEKRLSLGVYPDVSLKDARERRDEARKLLANDVDPSAHRKAKKAAKNERAANSFEVVAREWHAKQAPGFSTGHAPIGAEHLSLDWECTRCRYHRTPIVGRYSPY